MGDAVTRRDYPRVPVSPRLLQLQPLGTIKISNPMDSKTLAQYLEATDGISKPWLLVQLRLKKLQERRDTISSTAYAEELADIHQDLMNLGEWWRGIEDQVF